MPTWRRHPEDPARLRRAQVEELSRTSESELMISTTEVIDSFASRSRSALRFCTSSFRSADEVADRQREFAIHQVEAPIAGAESPS
jgi:hypothetical protein